MDSNQIRDAFLNFFAEKEHKIIPSSSLIPHGDPTLLLTTAGMVQIKPYFLGLVKPPNPRLASCQKCFRTTDIDSVGDNKHLTFFEMLGNFSVGDYFKKEAVAWAWEFVTDRLKLDPEKLWVTIFLDDDEAYDIWRSINFPAEKIVRLGEKDNFWGPAGDSGPCGPCSEIHYDFGDKFGCGQPDCGPDCSCGRFSEIWNLVFTEYNQAPDGSRTKLPKPNIDTGMGLERVVAASQGNPSVYDTDLFQPMLKKLAQLTGKTAGKNESVDKSLKIITEHSRGITLLIADGVLPSNEGRGYVLRRILRRACFLGHRLGIKKIFIGEIAEIVINKMGKVYPELVINKKLIFDVIRNEEEKFNDTLDAGINLCEKAIADAKAQKRNCLLSEEVFKFWDTYGFPFELSLEIAHDHGMEIDQKGFEVEMEKQRERARSSHKFTSAAGAGINSTLAHNSHIQSDFVGYDHLSVKSRINQIMDETTSQLVTSAKKGQKIVLILDRTPFYGEMGGQVGDTGTIQSKSGEVRVTNSISLPNGHIAISGNITAGTISVGDAVDASVDEERRLDVARNHTATHILQTAMRKILGSHVSQRGSLVAPERLRFDFTHLASITRDELKEIQAFVNDVIRKDLPVATESCSYDKAIKEGAMAIFEEKYGDVVRVVQIGEPRVSAELCGGTHVKTTGEIGYFVVVNESSIGTGLRRIEAVTGRGAESFVNERLSILTEAANELKAPIAEIPEKIRSIADSLSSCEKQIAAQQKELARYEVHGIIKENRKEVGGIQIVNARVSSIPMSTLLQLGDFLKEELKSAVIVLATVYEDKPYFMATITPDLVQKGLHSGKLVKKVAEIAGGSGGGKAETAQAGAKYKEKLTDALGAVPQIVKDLLDGKYA